MRFFEERESASEVLVRRSSSPPPPWPSSTWRPPPVVRRRRLSTTLFDSVRAEAEAMGVNDRVKLSDAAGREFFVPPLVVATKV